MGIEIKWPQSTPEEIEELRQKVARFIILGALNESSGILHAPQTLEVIGEEFKEGRPSIILAKENEWWRKKKK